MAKEIIRYRERRDCDSLSYFGEQTTESTWDYEWHFGQERVGIIGLPTAEAECFISGFLVQKDKLILRRGDKCFSPSLNRESEPIGCIHGEENRKGASALIDMLLTHKKVHCFLSSSSHESLYSCMGPILTFSPNAPSKEMYEQLAPMPVILSKYNE